MLLADRIAGNDAEAESVGEQSVKPRRCAQFRPTPYGSVSRPAHRETRVAAPTISTHRRTAVFIDFENVPTLDAVSLPEDTSVLFFRGAKQKSIDDTTLDAIAALPPGRFKRITISGEGKNALDFHIAFYLSEELRDDPTTRCIVVSKDDGFDPLIAHLKARGFHVSRCPSLKAAFSGGSQATAATKNTPKGPKSPPTLDEVVSFLAGHPAANRPRKRSGLVRIVETRYKGRICLEQAEALVRKVFEAGAVSEADGKLTFHC
jgi:hypothetical protein